MREPRAIPKLYSSACPQCTHMNTHIAHTWWTSRVRYGNRKCSLKWSQRAYKLPANCNRPSQIQMCESRLYCAHSSARLHRKKNVPPAKSAVVATSTLLWPFWCDAPRQMTARFRIPAPSTPVVIRTDMKWDTRVGDRMLALNYPHIRRAMTAI